jgi:hypothetical protein
MKTRITLAAALAALVGALVPTAAIADSPGPGDAVKADLTQLSTDVSAAHTTLVADLNAIATAAKGGDRAGVVSGVKQFRTDSATLLPAVKGVRQQLLTDIEAARAAKVTGLGPLVRATVKQDRGALREILQAAHQARGAVRALRQASSP